MTFLVLSMLMASSEDLFQGQVMRAEHPSSALAICVFGIAQRISRDGIS